MTHHIAVVDGKYQVYRVIDGKRRLDVGPPWADPATAAKYADLMDVSSLSGERDANTDAAPPVAPVDVALTADRGNPATGSVRAAGHRRSLRGWKRTKRAP